MEEKKNLQLNLSNVIKNLGQMNYTINEDDVLIQILKDKKNFQDFYSIYPSLIKNLAKYVKIQMELKYKLKKIKFFPPNKDYFWGSSSLETSPSNQITKLLIIMNDPLNYPGVFSKIKMCFNSIKAGSIFNFLEVAENKGFKVIVLNISKVKDNNKDIDLYLQNFWKLFIQIQLKYLNNIIILSHNNSSIPLIKLLNKNQRDFEEKIKKIILINSKHNEFYKIMEKNIQETFTKKTTNYILSNETTGNLIYSSLTSFDGCENRSCGTLNEEECHINIINELINLLI